jgi:beta-glucanase (GH16 family)
MKNLSIILAAALFLPVVLNAQEWHLVWSDEFEGEQLDAEKWSCMTGDGTEYGIPGWGNNELEYYREENVQVSGGNLVITAKQESFGGKQYTSGRIRTKDKGDWTYGRIEFRAKMPVGKGLWAAVWMLPTKEFYGGWAASGEIDIMEYLGHETDKVYGTLHYGGAWPNNRSSGGYCTTDSLSFGENFHDFAMEWEEGEFRWYVDDNKYLIKSSGWFSSAASFPAPFNRDFHLLVNMAVGGNWPGNPDGTTQFPQELLLDYIRIYQTGPSSVQDNTGQPGTVLKQNYPNPFGASTVIPYRIGSKMHVTLDLYDTLGRKVKTLSEGMHQPGSYTCPVDGSEIPPGIYYYRLSGYGFEKVMWMSKIQ